MAAMKKGIQITRFLMRFMMNKDWQAVLVVGGR